MEIKPQELRIGNLIDAFNGVHRRGQVTEIEVHNVSIDSGLIVPWMFQYRELNGIPLTEELLGRLGFQLVDATLALEDQGIKGPYYAKDALLLWSNGSEPKSAYLVFYADGFFGEYKAVRGRWIHTVHELQNTYHAWKGEELAIDKTSLKN